MGIDWSSTPPQLEASGSTGGPSPGGEDGALASYARAIRSHWFVATAVFVLVLAAGIAFSVVHSPSYQATARILVTPLPQSDTSFIGLPLIRDSGDPTRNMQTVATLIDSTEATQLTAGLLGGGWTAQRVQMAVNVQPEGQSQILDVVATASNANKATALANTFATAALETRSLELRRAVTQAITQTTAQLHSIKDLASVAAADLQDKLNQLRSLVNGVDPTISLSQSAIVPRSPSGLSKPLIVALALLAAFVLASGLALLLELVRARRVPNEEALLALLPGPVVARIPLMPRQLRHANAMLRRPLPPAVSEALRGVRIQLDLLRGRHRTILLTSPSQGDGKTTTAVNLARELVSSGARVIIIDTDLRKPDVGRSFNVEPALDLPNALESIEPLSWTREPPSVPGLRVLAAWPDEEFETLDRVARALPDFLEQALEDADYVILDAPPLGEVTDVLRFIGEVDDVLLVSRLGHTTVGSLEVTRELLDRAGRRPTGHIIIGSSPRHAPSYGYYYRSTTDGRGPVPRVRRATAPSSKPAGASKAPS